MRAYAPRSRPRTDGNDDIAAPSTARRPNRLSGLTGDLRYALRSFVRNPGFSLTVVATLAVGIGINAAVFAIVSAFLLRGFPQVEGNDRLVYIASAGSACCLSYPDFLDLREQAQSFDGIEVVHGFGASFDDDAGFAEAFDVTEVSAGTFGLVGAAPLLGRDFTAADQVPGAPPVVILSYGFWERRYAGDPGVIGSAIRLNGRPATIVGIMPQGFAFPQRQALWLPIAETPARLERDRRDLWFAFGRLRDGVTFDAAGAEVGRISERLAAIYPTTNRPRDGLEASSFREFFIGGDEDAIYASMWGAVAFVLLIACANLANLMLGRCVARAREISVRVALGASRVRILRQVLVESVLLAIVGGALGWWLARWAVGVYATAAHGPGWTAWRVLDYGMDYRVLIYLTVISVATGLLFGIAPASRLARVDVNAGLKAGGARASQSAGMQHLSAALVVTQVALAVVLLAGAAVMIRSFVNITAADTGVRAENVLTAYTVLPERDYPSSPSRFAFFDALRTRLEGQPGVESVAFVDELPTWGARSLPFELRDEPAVDEDDRPRVSALVASRGYFSTLGAAVLTGREFDATDRADSLPVAIVNQRFALEHWPGGDAVGRQLRVFGRSAENWLTVIGVVSNIVQDDATRQRRGPVVYLSDRQTPREGLWVVARTRVPPASLAADFRRAIEAVDPDLPLRFGPYTLIDRLAELNADRTLYVVLFFIFGTMALLLAAVGLYAVVAHSVSRRRQDIGIRMALGAGSRDIVALVVRFGLLPIVIGLAVGLVLAVALTRALEAELVGVSPADPMAYLVACGVLALAAAGGCLIPARRAMRVDPAVALRQE